MATDNDSPNVGEGVISVEDGSPGGEGVVHEQHPLVAEFGSNDVSAAAAAVVAERVGLSSEPSE